ncbi:MAG: DUF2628 domain-containing protein [Minisyncoccia bacterium]
MEQDLTIQTPPPAVEPPEINRWNWGAFFLTALWGIAHRVWFPLLAVLPVVGIQLAYRMASGTTEIMLVVLFVVLELIIALVSGHYGNHWAWQKKHWLDVATFQSTQKKWAKGGLICFIIGLIGIGANLTLSYSLSRTLSQNEGLIPSQQAVLPADFPKALILDSAFQLINAGSDASGQGSAVIFVSTRSLSDLQDLYQSYFKNEGYYLYDLLGGGYLSEFYGVDQKDNKTIDIILEDVSGNQTRLTIDIRPSLIDSFPKALLLDPGAVIIQSEYQPDEPLYSVQFKPSLDDQQLYNAYINYFTNHQVNCSPLPPQPLSANWTLTCLVNRSFNSYFIHVNKESDGTVWVTSETADISSPSLQ